MFKFYFSFFYTDSVSGRHLRVRYTLQRKLYFKREGRGTWICARTSFFIDKSVRAKPLSNNNNLNNIIGTVRYNAHHGAVTTVTLFLLLAPALFLLFCARDFLPCLWCLRCPRVAATVPFFAASAELSAAAVAGTVLFFACPDRLAWLSVWNEQYKYGYGIARINRPD